MSIIFISHRSTDKLVADMLLDFLIGTGIPRDAIFCSSLPGNDIREKISGEVRDAITKSAVNIAILSCDYYQSAYCLNEAGVIWYKRDIPAIPIGLPEVDSNNMYGFFNSEYKIRRLDCDTDASYIYDTVREALRLSYSKSTIITNEIQKLKTRYAQHIEGRQVAQTVHAPDISAITTDDERVVLYYILEKKVRKVTKTTVCDWLQQNEVFGINVDNAFDLLSMFDGGSNAGDEFELGIDYFRNCSRDDALLHELKPYVDKHTKLAADTFKVLWESDTFDDTLKLFVAYISEERVDSLGDRWMASQEIESIKQWEEKNSLLSTLSDNYGTCLEFFKQHELVFASDWTRDGNARQFTLYPSLQKLLLDRNNPYIEGLRQAKETVHFELPF